MYYIIPNSRKSFILFQKSLFCAYRTSPFTRQYVHNQFVIRKCFPIKSETLKKWNQFHTTGPKNVPPPLILMVLRVATQITSVFFGRKIRRWWKALPAGEKQKIKDTKIKPYIGSIIGSYL